MAEVHLGAELDKVGGLGGHHCIRCDSLQPGRAPEQGHVAGRLGRSGQKQLLRLVRKFPELPVETMLDAAG